MLIVIVVTIFIEKLVQYTHHIPEQYHPIVHKLEEEFMIMGAVSFLIVLVEVSAGVTHTQLLNIEFAHLLLFFAAINLVLNALKQLTSMGECQAHWDRLERCDRAKMVERLVQQDHESQHLLHRIGRSLHSFFRPYTEFDARESAEHLVMRKVFCDAFKLRDFDERGRQFDFSMYLRRSFSEIVCSLIEISLVAWGVLFVCIVAILIVVAALGQIDDDRVIGHGEEPAGWSLLGLRLLLVLWIRKTRSAFLRKHAGCVDEASLEQTLRMIADLESSGMETTLDDVRKSMTTQDFEHSDTNGDGSIDQDEFRRMQSRARMAKAHEHANQAETHAAVNMFDEARTKQLKRKKKAEVRAVQDQLSAGVWIGGRPELYLSALGVAKIIEAFYFALVVLNGVTTAGLVLGPSSWWLGLLLVLPILISSQLATMIVRDFALMYAICKASADILMEVEHTSSVMQRSYEELRSQFHTMFVRANPTVPDMLEKCYQAFIASDTDADGSLSHKEFSQLVRQLTGEAASTKMLKKLLRMIDIDQSGQVDVEEFLRFAAPLQSEDGADDVDIEQLEERIDKMMKTHVRDSKTRNTQNGGIGPVSV